MLIRFLTKSWKGILDILIIIAVVVAIFIINPWNIFGGGAKLNPTANNVSAIKELGQLVTAEYFGETIATFDKSQIRLIEEDDISEQAEWLFEQLKREVFSNYVEELIYLDSIQNLNDKKFRLLGFLRKNKNEKKVENSLTNDITLDTIPLYHDVIEYYWMFKNQSLSKRNRKYETKYESKAIISLGNEVFANYNTLNEIQFEEYLQSGLPSNGNNVFSDFYYKKLKDKNKKELKKKELAMIGRGWVKAGFDFGELDKNNFMFDKENGIVHIFGVNVEILNADINPWFIPEKKIPGFQIIEANKNVDFYDAKQVKMYCVEKLRKMALDAGILEQAEKQGEESIKNLIGLVSGIEVQEVHFHYDLFSVKIKEIINDEYISYVEAKLLDTLISKQLDTIIELQEADRNYTEKQKIKNTKINQLKLAIESVKACKYEGGDTYNRLAYCTYKISADSVLTEQEIIDLKKLRWNLDTMFNNKSPRRIIEKQVWYNDELDFINEFNEAFNFIDSNTVFANLKESIVDTTTWNNQIRDEHDNKNLFDLDVNKDSVYYVMLETITDSNIYKDIRYPILIPTEIDSAFIISKSEIKEVKNKIKDGSKYSKKLQLGNPLANQIDLKVDSTSTIPTANLIGEQSLFEFKSVSNNVDTVRLDEESKLILVEILNAYLETQDKSLLDRIAGKTKKMKIDSMQIKMEQWTKDIL